VEEVDEKPVQKLTTAGAESVPPAPWVNTKGARFLFVSLTVEGLYWWQIMGLLTSSESMMKLVAEVDGEVELWLSIVVAAASLFVSGFFFGSTAFFAFFAFAFLVDFLGFLSIFPVSLALSGFVLRLSSCDFCV